MLKNSLSEMISNSNLEEILDTYYYSTQIYIFALDCDGNIIKSSGVQPRFCSWFNNCTESKYCKISNFKASKISISIGDTYIFFSPAGLIHWTCPIIYNDVFLGSLVAGPVLMEYPNNLLVDDIIKNFNIDIDQKSALLSTLRDIIVVGPTQVRYYAKLLYYLSYSLIPQGTNMLDQNRERMSLHSQMSDFVRQNKTQVNYPYDKERELYSKVRSGDILGARTLLNQILGHIFFIECKDSSVIKSRIIELCSILSRAAVEGGAPCEEIFKISDNFIYDLKELNTIEDISFWLMKILNQFTKNVLHIPKSKNEEIIQNAIEYIHHNYSSKLSLDTVAEKVHLNPTYFSTLFKKETNSNFTSYINNIRITEAKNLLKSSKLTVMDIAVAIGFEDQCYFTKVFKNIVGVTPKQYRNLYS